MSFQSKLLRLFKEYNVGIYKKVQYNDRTGKEYIEYYFITDDGNYSLTDIRESNTKSNIVGSK